MINVKLFWVEIVNTKAKNILCCSAFRHPASFSPLRFKERLESTLSQLTSENKSIFIMGVFDINLLNYESHPESNDSLLIMLNSFFLLPYILQPPHITERSATLIDNNYICKYLW